jgi:hypothetical protein
MRRKLNIYDYLFYLSLLVITIWLILKSVGIIQTPFWLEYGVPVGGFVVATLTLYQNLLDKISRLSIGFATLNTKFSHLDNEVKEFKSDIKRDFSELRNDIGVLKSDFNGLKIDVNQLKKK